MCSLSALLSDLLLLPHANKLTEGEDIGTATGARSTSMANSRVQSEDFGAPSLYKHSCYPQPAAGADDGHGKQQAENVFATVAGTKVLAAVALASEEWEKPHLHSTNCLRWRLVAAAASQELFASAAVMFLMHVGMPQMQGFLLDSNKAVLYNTQQLKERR